MWPALNNISTFPFVLGVHPVVFLFPRDSGVRLLFLFLVLHLPMVRVSTTVVGVVVVNFFLPLTLEFAVGRPQDLASVASKEKCQPFFVVVSFYVAVRWRFFSFLLSWFILALVETAFFSTTFFLVRSVCTYIRARLRNLCMQHQTGQLKGAISSVCIHFSV